PKTAICTSRCAARTISGRSLPCARAADDMTDRGIPAIRTLRPAIWIAVTFLILIAATQLVTWWVARSMSRDFDARAQRHLSGDVQHVRDRIANIERHLNATAARLESRL